MEEAGRGSEPAVSGIVTLVSWLIANIAFLRQDLFSSVAAF